MGGLPAPISYHHRRCPWPVGHRVLPDQVPHQHRSADYQWSAAPDSHQAPGMEVCGQDGIRRAGTLHIPECGTGDDDRPARKPRANPGRRSGLHGLCVGRHTEWPGHRHRLPGRRKHGWLGYHSGTGQQVPQYLARKSHALPGPGGDRVLLAHLQGLEDGGVWLCDSGCLHLCP